MLISEQIFGAIIGASAAVAAQIVATISQYLINRKQLTLMERELHIAANQSLFARKVEAILRIRAYLVTFRDNEIDAMETYRKIRPDFIFLSDKMEREIHDAILANTPGSDYEKTRDEAFQCLSNVLQSLKGALISIESGANG